MYLKRIYSLQAEVPLPAAVPAGAVLQFALAACVASVAVVVVAAAAAAAVVFVFVVFVFVVVVYSPVPGFLAPYL